MISPSKLDSCLIIFGRRRSRFAISNCCTSRLHVVNNRLRPCSINCSDNAHNAWLFPEPGFPNSSTFSRRSRSEPSRKVSNCRTTCNGNRLNLKAVPTAAGSSYRSEVESQATWKKITRALKNPMSCRDEVSIASSVV